MCVLLMLELSRCLFKRSAVSSCTVVVLVCLRLVDVKINLLIAHQHKNSMETVI